ncbi:hypothetical protein [Streptomyces sp. NPDC002845]
MSKKAPSLADQLLIDHAKRYGYTVTAKQLDTWRRARLLPGNIPDGGRGQGKGSASHPAPEAFDLVVALARHAARGRRPKDLALLLFAEGLPVPEPTVRAAFRVAVDGIRLTGEADDRHEAGPALAEEDEDLDERVGRLADQAGVTVTLVPARARRIDERIARFVHDAGGMWPPPELAGWDRNPEPSPHTPQGATTAVVDATLRGGAAVTPQGIGNLLRALNPGMEANPIASLVEYTEVDVSEETAAMVFDPDGGMVTVPDGDARDSLRILADAAPLEDLAAAWKAAQDVRDWALDLCDRVEGELEAGQPGAAVDEWTCGRLLLSGVSVLEALRDRRWSPAKGAISALSLLQMRQGLSTLKELVPGCQWDVLELPGVLPPPARELLRSAWAPDHEKDG